MTDANSEKLQRNAQPKPSYDGYFRINMGRSQWVDRNTRLKSMCRSLRS